MGNEDVKRVPDSESSWPYSGYLQGPLLHIWISGCKDLRIKAHYRCVVYRWVLSDSEAKAARAILQGKGQKRLRPEHSCSSC